MKLLTWFLLALTALLILMYFTPLKEFLLQSNDQLTQKEREVIHLQRKADQAKREYKQMSEAAWQTYVNSNLKSGKLNVDQKMQLEKKKIDAARLTVNKKQNYEQSKAEYVESKRFYEEQKLLYEKQKKILG